MWCTRFEYCRLLDGTIRSAVHAGLREEGERGRIRKELRKEKREKRRRKIIFVQ